MPPRRSDPKTNALAKRLAELTGLSQTDAVRDAIQARLDQIEKTRGTTLRIEELDRIALHCAKLPRHDQRSANEIIGYDNRGVFGA